MKAAVVGDKGLEIHDVPQPRPKPNEVLVRVRAAGLNRAELAIAAGHRHGSQGGPGAIPGLEWSGEVVEIGAEVRGIKPGDRVMCTGGGGYAEFAVTDWGRVSPIPANNMSFVQAATLPVALQTMHNALVTNGRLKSGESVLIQGASSGVGLMGLQIAKHKGAKLVMGTSTNAARRARLKSSAPTSRSIHPIRHGRRRSPRPRKAKASISSSIRYRRASPTRT
jgi:NADPH2:quinone reductase